MEELRARLEKALVNKGSVEKYAANRVGLSEKHSVETDAEEAEIIKIVEHQMKNPLASALFKKTKSLELLVSKIQDESREILYWRRTKDLLNQEELTTLYMSLEKHATPPFEDPESPKLIDYEDFRKAVDPLDDKIKAVVTPKVFSRLLTINNFGGVDNYGRVPIVNIFHYAMRKTWLTQSRVGLSLYDQNGDGYLTEVDMDAYITELVPTLHQLNYAEPTYLPFHICGTVRKFFFFLDPYKMGRIKILDILLSGFIDEILELREEEPAPLTNWFSYASLMNAYGEYLNIDTDMNGMLCKSEFMRVGSDKYALTKTFVDCLFQECLTYEDEMDFKTFSEFLLAMKYKNEPPGIQYFFRILDFRKKGYLDEFSLHYFFKEVEDRMTAYGPDPISFENVKTDLFDMVSPQDPTKITLQDLYNCSGDQAGKFITMLIDLIGFWSVENRETDTNTPPKPKPQFRSCSC